MTSSLQNNNKRIIGRPTKLTPVVQGIVTDFVSKGNYLITACQAAGIGKSTYLDWIERGEIEFNNSGGLYSDFMLAIKKAEAEAEAEMLRIARSAALEKKDGYLAITVNERRHPERWGRKDRSLIQIDEHKTVTITNVEVIKDYGRGMIAESDAKEIEEKKDE